MLHLGDEYLVASADVRASERLRHQVYSLGRSSNEDDLAGACGVEESLNFFTRFFVGTRCALAQKVNPTMDVRVVFSVAPDHRIDNHLRFLCGGRVVEVNEGLSVNALVQYRKVAAHLLNIECGYGLSQHEAIAP
jgi:hypothetical protein